MATAGAKLVKEIMSRYPMKARRVRLLADKGKKAVWSIQTEQGEFILKKVPLDASRIAFMIHAVGYLKRNGVCTPAIVATTSGEGYAAVGGEYYVLFEAVRGRSPDYGDENELRMIMRSMAAFHRASAGIEPPPGASPSMLLLEWKRQGETRMERLYRWQTQRSSAPDTNAMDRLFLKHVDRFVEQCRSSLARLEEPAYNRWVEETCVRKTLCHQDFAAANLAIGSDGALYVYDMDSLTVDLPVRDIRKILNKVMKKGTDWELPKMLLMLKAYQEIYPLTKEQYKILAADVQFPHLFYGQVSKYYERRETEWTLDKHVRRLEEMIATETSKSAVLQSFLDRLDELVEP